jgi:hypothetical protein
MINLEQYLSVPYVEGGRTLDGLDCWGLVLLVRESMGLGRLPSIGGAVASQPLAVDRAHSSVSAELDVCTPEPGAVAAVFRNRLFIHAGVVVEIDGRLAVIETNPKVPPRILWLADFERTYFKVVYYRDRDLHRKTRR